MTLTIPRKNYVDLFGPTVGDRVRLADTDLIIEIEKDLIKYGDEAVFGGGKSIRDGLGQASGISRAESIAVGVEPQSSCNFKPQAPASICSIVQFLENHFPLLRIQSLMEIHQLIQSFCEYSIFREYRL